MKVDNKGQRDWQEEIREVQRESVRAFLEQDVEGLATLVHDGLAVNSPLGTVLTKSKMLELLQRGVIRHFSYEEQIESMTRFGDCVVVLGSDVVTNAADGPPVRRRFTNVWQRMNGAWVMIARHAHHVVPGSQREP